MRPGRDVVLKTVIHVDLQIGFGTAWSEDDLTTARDGIIGVARIN